MISAALLCLAMTVYHEARGEGFAGQAAVAAVVMNRVRSPRFPDDVCAVVTQPGQFTFRWRPPRNGKAWERAVDVAAMTLAGILPDPTGGALWYHSRRIGPPTWTRGKTAVTIGNHTFYTPTQQRP